MYQNLRCFARFFARNSKLTQLRIAMKGSPRAHAKDAMTAKKASSLRPKPVGGFSLMEREQPCPRSSAAALPSRRSNIDQPVLDSRFARDKAARHGLVFTRSQACPAPGVHFDRTARRDRHHRDPRRHVAAGLEQSQGV